MPPMERTDLGLSEASALTDAAGLAEPAPEPPFVLIEPLRRTAPLIFASPHSACSSDWRTSASVPANALV